MKQVLEFEKPVVKLREEIEEARKKFASKPSDKLAAQISDMEAKADALHKDIHTNLNPWQRVQISRHIARPFFLDYVRMAFSDFVELKGDRLFGDDASMPGGLASIDGVRCVVIGQQKGRDMKENLLRNFGSPHPARSACGWINATSAVRNHSQPIGFRRNLRPREIRHTRQHQITRP